jgi:DNA-binding XRE family transcriptional regulator
MESQMNIDAAVVKTIREQKAWSQEQLASVAGISLRTVQRVEAEGVASAETRMALASALGVSAQRLFCIDPAPRPQSVGSRIGMVCGWLGWALGGLFSLVGAHGAGLSGAEAGVTCGAIGLFLGLTGASLGVLGQRLRKAELSGA